MTMTDGKLLMIVTEDVIDKLKSGGFTIQRYDAYNTNSIYLKLDYGVCNSIRISDHEGKPYLKYRYNLLTECNTREVMDTFIRYYYNVVDVNMMIRQILDDRHNKLNRYGISKYQTFMQKNKDAHEESSGFWEQAKLVCKGD